MNIYYGLKYIQQDDPFSSSCQKTDRGYECWTNMSLIKFDCKYPPYQTNDLNVAFRALELTPKPKLNDNSLWYVIIEPFLK